MSIFSKVLTATEVALDEYIAKSKANIKKDSNDAPTVDRKGFVELDFPEETQYGYKERRGLVGPGVLKNMGRKDSIIAAIVRTRLSQISAFTQPQEDRYSPGFIIKPRNPADISIDDKLELADPEIQKDDDAFNQLKFEMEQKRAKLQKKQKEDKAKITEFILHGGMPSDETDTTHKRFDFDKCMSVMVNNIMHYNYIAIELIPTKDRSKLHHFYPVDAGTIRYVSAVSAEKYEDMIKPLLAKRGIMYDPSKNKPFKYVQVIRGRVVAAWTEDEMIFEPMIPTVDPEDNGYAMGNLELLIHVVTAHLYAEAHNRNFFTQGIGTKGILHIKGDNISRTQLEAFKRQWFNQVINSKNAFRPPVIGMADEVRWVSLAQSNREMEFEQWMNYLIRITCAIYQIDPAEINFDISKVSSSTLNEANNETRIKMSRDKGLAPLLDFLENIVNNHILRYWNAQLADKYEFKFVGLELETKIQEQDRLEKETRIWKTINEARIEMGFPPIEDGDIILNAAYTQYKQQRQANQQAEQDAMNNPDQQGMDAGMDGQGQDQTSDANISSELTGLNSDLQSIVKDAETEVDQEIAQEEKDKAAKEKTIKKPEETKKSQATVIEYYIKDDNKDED